MIMWKITARLEKRKDELTLNFFHKRIFAPAKVILMCKSPINGTFTKF